jgi:general secretion pathway protein D
LGGLGAVATHVFSRGRVEAALNAFASNRNLNILSTPRIFTRSGNEAEILVGIDVPIITSQRASENQSGGDTDVLQTVQYRQTGIILNVRPIVYGDGRIDISLYQEVSSQQPNTSAAINSPLILNRSVSTQISLQEGMTAVIGGLMQDTYTRDQRGIPGLKDLPFIGAAFRSEEVTGDKVELVILLTPYIVRDDDDVEAMTEALTRSVNGALRQRGAQVYTLYPWRAPFASSRTHERPIQRTRPTTN